MASSWIGRWCILFILKLNYTLTEIFPDTGKLKLTTLIAYLPCYEKNDTVFKCNMCNEIESFLKKRYSGV